MNNSRIFVTRRRIPEAIALLEKEFEVEVWPETTPPPASVMAERAAACVALMVEADDAVTEAVLEAGKDSLKIVSVRAAGMDNIDMPAATARGIIVANTPGLNAESTADMTFALILAVARKVAFGDRRIREGAWTAFDQVPYLGTDVYGKTLGILGLGDIGEKVAKRAIGFEMNVIYSSRTRKPEEELMYGLDYVELDELLATSDYVTVHVPLGDKTRPIIGARELALMKPDAYLINASRGPTVDTVALTDALRAGLIAGAGLDVTDPEPIPADHPLVTMDNVVITPHIGSASAATFKAMGMAAARSIAAALKGEPVPYCANPEVLPPEATPAPPAAPELPPVPPLIPPEA
jgi:glyoxylate reductase